MTDIVTLLENLLEAKKELQIPEDRGPVKNSDGQHVGCPECGYPLGSQDGEILPCALCGWGHDYD